MKITINTDDRYAETEIIVNCKHMNDEIEKLIASFRVFDMKLMGYKEGRQCIIDITDVIYIESTDKRSFLYTLTGIYESHYRLYELEEKLDDIGFTRVSKNCLVNIG
jgi:DNA-binding LytR/AlgR family response regulator